MNRIFITGQTGKVVDRDPLVSGTVGAPFAIEFDKDWDGYAKTICFRAGKIQVNVVNVGMKDQITIPHEVLAIPCERLHVGVYGTLNDSVKPIVWVNLDTILEGTNPEGIEPTDPTLPIWAQIIEMIGALSDLETVNSDNLVAAINEVLNSIITDHSKLSGLDDPDQHPITSVIGLADALDSKQPVGNYLTEETDPGIPIHNVSDSAHTDIRSEIASINKRLNAFLDSDDQTLDELSEIVSYIKSNKSLIDAITISKVNVSDIVNDLVTSVANKPLSAAQGVVLNLSVSKINDNFNSHASNRDIHVTSEDKKRWDSNSGVSNHGLLAGRDLPDQHPIDSISGLRDALESKQPVGNYLTEETDPGIPIHNTDSKAHNDIRIAIKTISDRLNAFLDSDDQTLDELSEIVAYIKSNKDIIDAITISKVNVSDIVDDLVTNAPNKPLSAAQGVALDRRITETAHVQSDWGENDFQNPAFIKQRPFYDDRENISVMPYTELGVVTDGTVIANIDSEIKFPAGKSGEVGFYSPPQIRLMFKGTFGRRQTFNGTCTADPNLKVSMVLAFSPTPDGKTKELTVTFDTSKNNIFEGRQVYLSSFIYVIGTVAKLPSIFLPSAANMEASVPGGLPHDIDGNVQSVLNALTTDKLSKAGHTPNKNLVTDESGNVDWEEKPTIPTKLPNPNSITFTGGATGSYDGTQPVTVDIPTVDDILAALPKWEWGAY